MATEYVDRVKLGSDVYPIQSNAVVDSLGGNATSAETIFKSGNLINVTYVSFEGSNWVQSGTFWCNTKTLQGITASDEPLMCGLSYPAACTDATRKLIQKAVGYIVELETGASTLTLRATRKPPVVDITLALRGLEQEQE